MVVGAPNNVPVIHEPFEGLVYRCKRSMEKLTAEVLKGLVVGVLPVIALVFQTFISLYFNSFSYHFIPLDFNSINDKALQSNWGLLNKTSALSGDNGTDSAVKGDTPHSCGLLCWCSRASSTTHCSCLCHELKSCSPRFAPYVLRFVT